MSKDCATLSPEETLVFDGGDCPDIIPVFALACCLRKGRSEIVNISRLRIKECDRLSATVSELKKLGADITGNERFDVNSRSRRS